MKKYVTISLFLISALLMILIFTACPQQTPDTPQNNTPGTEKTTPEQPKYLTIGTGGVTGVYFPVGGAIAKLINTANVGPQVTVESTGGSVFNVKAMNKGELDMGMAQSDVVYQAYNQEGEFKYQPVEKLRVLFSLHPEPMHLIARKNANIKSVVDLREKKVNLGNPGSGTLNFTTAILDAYGVWSDELFPEYLKAAEAPDFLRDGRIDAFFYPAGVGNASVQDISTTADVNIVPIAGEQAKRLVKKFPYYTMATIPPQVYRGVEEPVQTVGVKALFVTTTDIPEETVYQIVKLILDRFGDFQAAHNALAGLEPRNLLDAVPIPLHPGSEKAFQEAGLLEISPASEDSTGTD